MSRHSRLIATFILIIPTFIAISFWLTGCSSDSPAVQGDTGSSQVDTGEASLLFDQLAVAVVPTGRMMVIVYATEASGAKGDFTARIEDPSIASMVATDADIEVTGIALGRTNLVVSGPEGLRRQIPVHVYDPIEADFGEIRLRFWTNFEARGYWGDPEDEPWYRYYHPVFPEGFEPGWRALGSMVLRHTEVPERDRVMLVARADDDADPVSPPLVPPTGYDLIDWSDTGVYSSQAYYYRANCPAGYKTLGAVVMFRDKSPAPDEVACVRADLVHFGELSGDPIFNLWMEKKVLDSQYLYNFDDIVPITAPPHEAAYIPIGSLAVYHWDDDGNRDPVVNVLEIDLPIVVESEEQKVIPRLTSIHAPPDQSLPVLSRAILVPYTMIKDQEYQGREDWQIANSPFYRLERDVFYKLRYFNYNQTSVTQQNQVEIVSGVVESQSTQFWEETGVSITKETGISLGYKGVTVNLGKQTANVSRKMGYATITNVSELREDHITTTVYTAAGKAAAMWQKYNRFTLKRHNGSSVEIVSVYEFGINEFVTDEY